MIIGCRAYWLIVMIWAKDRQVSGGVRCRVNVRPKNSGEDYRVKKGGVEVGLEVTCRALLNKK